MALFEQFANLAQTTLILPAAAGATTLYVNSAAKFPSAGQFRIVVDSEIFLVTNVAGNVFTVQPGYEGSTESAHLAGRERGAGDDGGGGFAIIQPQSRRL